MSSRLAFRQEVESLLDNHNADSSLNQLHLPLKGGRAPYRPTEYHPGEINLHIVDLHSDEIIEQVFTRLVTVMGPTCLGYNIDYRRPWFDLGMR